jgi:serine/threonine protein kinase
MNGQRWRRIGEIYESALPVLESDRSTFVAGICGSDTILQQEVNSLLEADASSGDFLESSAFELGLKVLMDDSSKNFDTSRDPNRPAPDDLVGTTVDGRYLIEKKLGQGGVGAVYLARDQKLHDKPVVVKVLLEKSLRDKWVLQKFQQEKEALARVDHPGVVGISDTGELSDGKPYIVMQFVDGGSLRDAIRAKPEGMDLERVASIVRQTGAALSAVHEKKIYHRDLKPENMMLQNLGRGVEQVKIVDFGIAKVKESVVAPSTITGAATAGTIIYMSPEQLRGDRVSPASDIYSFGVIAYEMVTGRRPFNPDTIARLSEMQREGIRVKPIDLRPRLPQEAQALILNALAFEPKARHQNAAEFGDALASALMNEEETLKQPRREVADLLPEQLSVDPNPREHQASEQLARALVTPVQPARVQTHEQARPLPVEPEIQKRRWPQIGIALVLAVALVAGYFLIMNRQKWFGGGTPPAPINASVQRSLAYSLTVQKMRDGKLYQEPFESSGQEIYENGYKFRLNISSPQSGYLYVFNEGAPEKDGTSFTIIYPTPATNKGSAKLDANETIQTNWNTFEGQTGTEQFWIVWSASPVAQLEAARDAAFRHQEGALTDVGKVTTVKEYLTKHSDPKPETAKNTTKQQTDVRANGDLLVKLVELEHR